jgi:hypothetical protein
MIVRDGRYVRYLNDACQQAIGPEVALGIIRDLCNQTQKHDIAMRTALAGNAEIGAITAVM